MKFIEKNLKDEPKTLIAYRATPSASYAGFGDKGKLLKTALCKAQGYICCYCMRRIDENSMSVEHYIAQKHHELSPFSIEIHRDNELKFTNLLAACNSKERGCSEIRGNKPLTINPLNKNIEILLSFKNINYEYTTETVKHDIENILQLNKDKKLEDARKVVLDNVRENLPKNSKEWTTSRLNKELEKWKNLDKNGRFRPFCQVAISYLNKKIHQVSRQKA